ncbi:hypothetical protein [Phenylobacterium sp.]|jgi:hypothetical protein|uniref:hypothetical protein n=1 Tax=Phenylobacterium sp. TaxID=1871053 RepID=UPI00378330BA
MGRPKPAVPSEQEILRLVRTLRSTTSLCRFEAARGNEGFTGSFSFNPVEHRSSASDFIEIALRTASFTFSPADPKGWSWGEALKELVHVTATETTVKEGHQENATQGATAASKSELSGEVGVKLPLVGQVKAGARQTAEFGRSAARTVGRAIEATRVITRRWAEIHRRGDDFELRLGSPGGEDLVRLNADMDRIGVLQSDEPSSADLESISVTMRLQYKGPLDHALRFREASGSWSRLVDTRAKQAVAELMFAKFVRPAHKPLRLWPRRPV